MGNDDFQRDTSLILPLCRNACALGKSVSYFRKLKGKTPDVPNVRKYSGNDSEVRKVGKLKQNHLNSKTQQPNYVVPDLKGVF